MQIVEIIKKDEVKGTCTLKTFVRREGISDIYAETEMKLEEAKLNLEKIKTTKMETLVRISQKVEDELSQIDAEIAKHFPAEQPK
jgi:hypothetical protein